MRVAPTAGGDGLTAIVRVSSVRAMSKVKAKLRVTGARLHVRHRVAAETAAVVRVAEVESVVERTGKREAWLCE